MCHYIHFLTVVCIFSIITKWFLFFAFLLLLSVHLFFDTFIVIAIIVYTIHFRAQYNTIVYYIPNRSTVTLIIVVGLYKGEEKIRKEGEKRTFLWPHYYCLFFPFIQKCTIGQKCNCCSEFSVCVCYNTSCYNHRSLKFLPSIQEVFQRIIGDIPYILY